MVLQSRLKRSILIVSLLEQLHRVILDVSLGDHLIRDCLIGFECCFCLDVKSLVVQTRRSYSNHPTFSKSPMSGMRKALASGDLLSILSAF